MNNKLFNYLIIGLVTVVVFILLLFVSGLVISTIVALAVGIAVYFILKKQMDKNDKPSVAEEEPLNAEDVGISALLHTNIELRKTIIPTSIRDAFEQVIDQLIDLLPKVNAASPDGELAWVINRMATEYLPEKSVKPYLALDEQARHDENTMTTVEEGLAGMKAELSDVEDILASRQTNEFNTKAKFLKRRFNV
ncbi:MAG: hypothetical protein ACN4GM_05570 [Gammaproteobacteria bacterium]